MERDCTAIQQDLVEIHGEIDRLDAGDHQHLERCNACSEIAREESQLARVLERALPPADPELQRQIIGSLTQARLRRRIFGILPVAASLFVVLAGISLLGSLPGSSLFTQLPRWTSESWMCLARVFRDCQIVLTATAASISSSMTTGTLIIVSLLSLVGVAAVVTLARAFRKKLLWQTSQK